MILLRRSTVFVRPAEMFFCLTFGKSFIKFSYIKLLRQSKTNLY